MVIIIIFL